MKLSDLQTKNGKFTIAACDQRASLATMLGVDPETPSGRETLERVKAIFMETFSPICSGVLTDSEFGLSSLKFRAKHAGLLFALERVAYDGKGNKDDMPLFYDRWGVREIAEHGGAVKILLWYNPKSANAERKQLMMKSIFHQAQEHHVPFLLEIILHPLAGQETAFTRHAFVLQLETVRTFTTSCDVLKLEAPMLPTETFDMREFRRRCTEITRLATVPWILLTRGMAYERFILALQLAMENGASGFAAGRAVWKEFAEFPTTEAQLQFIRTVGRRRMEELIKIGTSR